MSSFFLGADGRWHPLGSKDARKRDYLAYKAKLKRESDRNTQMLLEERRRIEAQFEEPLDEESEGDDEPVEPKQIRRRVVKRRGE